MSPLILLNFSVGRFNFLAFPHYLHFLTAMTNLVALFVLFLIFQSEPGDVDSAHVQHILNEIGPKIYTKPQNYPALSKNKISFNYSQHFISLTDFYINMLIKFQYGIKREIFIPHLYLAPPQGVTQSEFREDV